uniref:DUF676 domain-containing protein n=1 Tax=Globisporangium ultimum (strain ATCC 200006 / CBS 805.95 / DAOM BR144) TaxID=431595 RepID=K3WM73_GLOUD
MVFRSACTLALCAAVTISSTAAVETPTITSLKLGFHVKRSSMAIHGRTDFDVFINPIVSDANATTVSFNGAATFVQDGVTYKYVLVDGVPYVTAETAAGVSTTTCGSATSFPPVHEVFSAISSAVPVSTVDSAQAIECVNGSLLKAALAGEDYVLCTSTSDDGAFKAFGEDLDVEFQYLKEPAVIAKPAQAPTNCESVTENSVAWNFVVWSPLGNSAENVPSLAPTSGSERESRRCDVRLQEQAETLHLFHGMDVKADGGVVDDYSFFGDIKKHAPCCSSFKFAIMNTVDNAWTDDVLQQRTCDIALSMSPASNNATKTVEDTIVIAHSMGNLQLAGAIATGKCTLGKTTEWVDLSGPLKGSMGSDLIRDVCDGGNIGRDILKKLGGLIGQCPGTTTRKSLVYDGGAYCSATESAQYAAARKAHSEHVTASVCGRTYSGLLSKEYAGLLFGGIFIPHKSSENDGVVEFQSCIGDLPASQFQEDYASKFYRAKLNHADTTFHNGEGLFDKAKKPLKWFECLF